MIIKFPVFITNVKQGPNVCAVGSYRKSHSEFPIQSFTPPVTREGRPLCERLEFPRGSVSLPCRTTIRTKFTNSSCFIEV